MNLVLAEPKRFNIKAPSLKSSNHFRSKRTEGDCFYSNTLINLSKLYFAAGHRFLIGENSFTVYFNPNSVGLKFTSFAAVKSHFSIAGQDKHQVLLTVLMFQQVEGIFFKNQVEF